MKINYDYTYCIPKIETWPDQCKKCKRNIELYEKEDVGLYWTDLAGKRHLKKCPMYAAMRGE